MITNLLLWLLYFLGIFIIFAITYSIWMEIHWKLVIFLELPMILAGIKVYRLRDK